MSLEVTDHCIIIGTASNTKELVVDQSAKRPNPMLFTYICSTGRGMDLTERCILIYNLPTGDNGSLETKFSSSTISLK